MLRCLCPLFLLLLLRANPAAPPPLSPLLRLRFSHHQQTQVGKQTTCKIQGAVVCHGTGNCVVTQSVTVTDGFITITGDAHDWGGCHSISEVAITRSNHCERCAAGTYSPAAGSATCTACPAGTASATEAATAASTCATCAAGTFSATDASTTCSTCPPGAYSAAAGASSCTSCAAGTFLATAGSVGSVPGYTSAPITNGLVFDANANDWSGSGSWTSRVGSATATAAGSVAKATTGGIPAVQLRSDSDMFKFNLDVGPTSMPSATFETWVYLNSIDNTRGWLFGSENGGCDRYILLHDNRVSGTGPSCKNGNWGLGYTPTGQWSHVVTVYDQSSGTSYGFLNGVKGTVHTGITHNDGVANELRLGSPWGSHYANVDVAAVRVYDRVLSDSEVATLYSGTSGCSTCSAGTYAVAGSSSCTTCPTGKYSASDGASACTSCAVGEYASTTGATSCSTCASGAYSSVAGSSSCTTCTSGQYSAASGVSSCSSCSTGHFSADGASSCTSCSAGTYGSTAGASACTSCSSGQYSAASSASSCSTCSMGHYSSDGASSCATCSAGTYAATAGSSSCSSCAAGTYGSSDGASSCTSCAAGTFLATAGNTGASAGYTSAPITNGLVFDANANDWSGSGSWTSRVGSATATAAGSVAKATTGGIPAVQLRSDSDMFKFNLDVGPTSMPSATFETWVYLNSIDNTRGWLFGSENGGCDRYILLHDNRVSGTGPSCKNGNWGLGYTPTGQWSHVVTVYDQSSGTSYGFLNGVKGTVHTGITHNDGVANELRLGSPWGSHYANVDVAAVRVYDRVLSDSEVATLYAGSTGGCDTCSAGTYSSSGASACANCDGGKYSASDGASACSACSLGHYSSGGASSCTSCGAGTYGITAGASACTNCNGGQYSAASGSSSCSSCGTGQYATGGASSCVSCAAGTYASATGSSSCTTCASGTSSSEGASVCTSVLAQVTCRLTIDNYLSRVTYNGADLSVTYDDTGAAYPLAASDETNASGDHHW